MAQLHCSKVVLGCGSPGGVPGTSTSCQGMKPCSNFRDAAAETDLYQKSERLVEFLCRWESKGKTLIERVQEL